MGANTKEVKIRLQSINNTKKITKAMELVSAAKMRKTVQQALDTRSYHLLAWGIVDRLMHCHLWFATTNPIKRFFEPATQVKKAILIVVTSNRGLCGAFNSGVIKLALGYIKKRGAAQVTVITIGTRGAATLSAHGVLVSLAYRKEDTNATADTIKNIADHIYYSFLNNEVDQIMVAYTDYKSVITQTPILRQLFPFPDPPQVGQNKTDINRAQDTAMSTSANREYLYEPNKYDVLQHLVQRITQAELFQAVLESNASEHSARMVAMKNATDAAVEMAEDLLLIYNKARQAAITQEIAEISAGSAAVS